MISAGVKVDNHESDLYVPVNETTRAILAQYPDTARPTVFTSQTDGKAWFDIPFAFEPFWKVRSAEAREEEKTPFVHKGWACGYDASRPVTGRWYATRHGVGMNAGLRRELVNMIDLKVMPWWVVTYETRQKGAIGIFQAREFEVQAPDEGAAREAALKSLDEQGYEPRFPIKVERKTGIF
jgi:hypothetical protein